MSSTVDIDRDQLDFLYDLVMDKWKYVPDPEGRDIYNCYANEVLEGREVQGDCEDAAITWCELMRRLGASCSLWTCFTEEGVGHLVASTRIHNVLWILDIRENAPVTQGRLLSFGYKLLSEQKFGARENE